MQPRPLPHIFMKTLRKQHKYDLELSEYFYMQQVQSGSDILLGSTGSFKRFESVDRPSAYDGELVAAMPMHTSPWATDESIPPQPLRPAPLPLSTKLKSNKSSSPSTVKNGHKQQSFEAKPAPLTKALPRPTPRKQLSAPAGASSSQIPFINPPKNEKTVTNPFLNGLANFESIKSNFFSSSVQETSVSGCKIVNERATKSAVESSKNPFHESSSHFDFNPTTIKSIMEEAPDDGYDGDNDEIEDPLKQLEARIQKLEASNKQRRLSDTTPRFSPKSLNKTSPPTEKFADSSFNLENGYRKHSRSRSYSENEVCELDMVCEQEGSTAVAINTTMSSTNPFQTAPATNTSTNSKRPLLKTPSETYLEQYSLMKSNGPKYSSSSSVIVNNKTIQLCKHPSLTKILQSTPQSLNFDTPVLTDSALKRTISSESISSDSSVVMSTLERAAPPITGNLCIALQYDK